MPKQARRYGGQSADERDHERLTRLRAAAIELFGAEGYAAASVERLCSEAKVSTRHYYQLFSNKEDALLDTYSEITSASIANVQLALEKTAGLDITTRLQSAVQAYLDPMLDDARKARIAFVEVVGVSQRVEGIRLQFRNGIVELIQREAAAAVKRGELTPKDFRFRALAFLGAVNVLVHDWSIHPDHVDAGRLSDQLSDLAVELIVQA
ncbi:MAG TPA: TetR/AcrR family transcriptional regulator [Aeromicrobium sp.]|nr:TetR/AcrR family transcriptional regulator [Aeromicrobium sp.]